MTATASAPASMISRAFSIRIPPMATTGTVSFDFASRKSEAGAYTALVLVFVVKKLPKAT